MRRMLTLVTLTLASLASPAFGQTPPIVIDGNFADWAGIAPLMTDAEGDGPFNLDGDYFPGSDFRSVRLTHDATHLYILMEFAGNHTGGIALFLDTDMDSLTGCQGAELAVFVTDSEPGGHLGLADYRTCQLANTFPGAVTSLPAHNVSRFLEAAIPVSTLRELTPAGKYGFVVWGEGVAPPPTAYPIEYIARALYFPETTPNPVVVLQVNDWDPSSPVVFTTDGRVRLTVDVPATTYTGDLSWYWAVIIEGQVLWITAQGLSTTPAPFVVSPPLVLNHVLLLDVVIPISSPLYTIFFLMDGDTVVAWDWVMADVLWFPLGHGLDDPATLRSAPPMTSSLLPPGGLARGRQRPGERMVRIREDQQFG